MVISLLDSSNELQEFNDKISKLKYPVKSIVEVPTPKFLSYVCDIEGMIVSYDVGNDAYLVVVRSIPEYSNDCPNPQLFKEQDLKLKYLPTMQFSL